jgi:hypothetical protein
MLISKKIIKLNKLARIVVKHYIDSDADFTMIGLEKTKKGWLAKIIYEFLEDGRPQYLNNPVNNERCILKSTANTLPKALIALEKRMLEIISEENND